MQLFYAPDFTPPVFTLDREESGHAVKVLRLREGDTIHVTDGKGNMYRCRVTLASEKGCEVCVEETFVQFEKRPYRLLVAVAPTKNIDRWEWMLEKATEIGTDEFIPLDCDHSERRVIKPERESRVITSAVKQSLKAYHPVLREMTAFDAIAAMPFSGRKFIAHCDTPLHAKKYLPSAVLPGEDVLVAIGPEGDFSEREIRLAVENGFEEITLGVQRFRTETAAVVAVDMVSIVNAMKK